MIPKHETPIANLKRNKKKRVECAIEQPRKPFAQRKQRHTLAAKKTRDAAKKKNLRK